MKILVLYDKYSTIINNVYDHLEAFVAYSQHEHLYVDYRVGTRYIDEKIFDVIVIHFSIRLCYGVLNQTLEDKIRLFSKIKALFIQDEYDYIEITRKKIEKLNFDIVFTCVPKKYIAEIYPIERFKHTKFINVLTGYVPSNLELKNVWKNLENRQFDIGYRGRLLPEVYGSLGREKYEIAVKFKKICNLYCLNDDIEWDDSRRIYGKKWIDFLSNCRTTLGTESGSNIFDNEGEVRQEINKFKEKNPSASYEELYYEILKDKEKAGVMNQISPRIFEAASCGSGLILYEGNYSGIIKPNIHYISLKKDFSNIEEVVEKIKDNKFMLSIIENSYADLILSKKYSLSSFILYYDNYISSYAPKYSAKPVKSTIFKTGLTKHPLHRNRLSVIDKAPEPLKNVWRLLPLKIRMGLMPKIRLILDNINLIMGR